MTAPDFIWVEEPDIFDGMGLWHEIGSAPWREYVRRDPAVLFELPEVKALVSATMWDALGFASDEELLRELVRRNPPTKAPTYRTMHDQDCVIGIGRDHHCWITFQDEDLAALIPDAKE
jgi:hypothetical protein